MVDVPVNPTVLSWARQERRLSESEAAKRIGITEAELKDLETGAIVPNLGRLRDMAAAYEIAFATLLMPAPLPANSRPDVNDFRTHLGEGPEWTPELAVAIDEINELIEGLVDLRDSAPELFPDVKLPNVRQSDGAAKLAELQRRRLGISVSTQIEWDSERTAFNSWRAAIEAQGVFTYSEKLGDALQCKGFSVFDKRRIPALVVNAEEPDYAPKIFTLLHEFGHLLIRKAGISDENRLNPTERFCNQFAAYILMPPSDFRAVATAIRSAGYTQSWSDSVIAKLAKAFKVSQTAIAFHIEDLALAPTGFARDKMKEWFLLGRRSRRGGIATHAAKVTNRLGVQHVRVVLDALDARKINQFEAHELLNVRPEHFGNLRDEVRGRQTSYGG